MKKKTIGKAPVVLIIAVVTVVVLIGATTAYIILEERHEFSRFFNISNFSASADVYFDYGGSRREVSSYTDDVDGTIRLELADNTQVNYIGNLRFDVKYRGRGTALIRVKSVHQFMRDGKVVPMNSQVPYTISSLYTSQDSGNALKWQDNRANDYCLYLAAPVYGARNDTIYTLNVITGIKSGFSVPSGTTLNAAFELQAVQVNRYKQFWGIDTLPWNGANVNGDSDIQLGE
ncbi:MAG: hypothetical protein K5756_01300 [Clostridiales bacterium]|nr:hypothetical protein [Clostridiales bacterium]